VSPTTFKGPRYLQLGRLRLQCGGVLLQKGTLFLQCQDLAAEGHVLCLQVLQLLLQQLLLSLQSCVLGDGEAHANQTPSRSRSPGFTNVGCNELSRMDEGQSQGPPLGWEVTDTPL
jgi:hypothetical protein